MLSRQQCFDRSRYKLTIGSPGRFFPSVLQILVKLYYKNPVYRNFTLIKGPVGFLTFGGHTNINHLRDFMT